jgi:hypothetical protein
VLGLLVSLVFLCLVVWLLWIILGTIASQLPAPARQIVTIIFALVLLVFVLNWLGPSDLWNGWRWHR